MGEVLTVGIAGGTGSGKTTITKRVLKTFGEDVSVVYHDNYYRALDHMTYEERVKVNYDHPDAFETDLMIRQLRRLKRGETIKCPVYDYSIHNRSDQTVLIAPAKVILVEGILILSDDELCREIDVKLFVDTDADVRILRRIIRDVRDRGRSLDSVVTQYLTTVKPMHELYVEPSRRNADIIIPEGGYNKVALEMVMERIRAHVEGTRK